MALTILYNLAEQNRAFFVVAPIKESSPDMDETWAEFSTLEAAVCTPYTHVAIEQDRLT
jgi:hypothetical protein